MGDHYAHHIFNISKFVGFVKRGSAFAVPFNPPYSVSPEGAALGLMKYPHTNADALTASGLMRIRFHEYRYSNS